MTEQKNKTELKTKNPATPEIELLCPKNCSICQSGRIKEIHELWEQQKKYTEIIEFLKLNYNLEISKSALSRHFRKYRERQRLLSAEITEKKLIDKSTEIAIHQQAIVKLIDKAIYYIDHSLLKFDISDLEKLFKIRHQILEGKFEGEDNLKSVVNLAFSKYGIKVEQGIMNFEPPEKNVSEKSQEEKRAEDAGR